MTKSYTALHAYESLLVFGGRERQVPVVEDLTDVLIWGGRQHSHPGAVVGMKPAAFCEWMFQLLGATHGDQLDDIFPGSGAVQRAWKLYTSPADTTQLSLDRTATGDRRDASPGRRRCMNLRLLDLYCGEGGASTGYFGVVFEVGGIDLNDDWTSRRTRPRPLPLRRYPFRCLQGDVLEVLKLLLAGEPIVVDGDPIYLRDFGAIHASPPCQLHSEITRVFDRRGEGFEHPELIAPTRALLDKTGLPYVIENVINAPMAEESVLLCGSMFDPPLDVRRHRLFETNWGLEAPAWGCRHKLWAPRYQSADYRGRKSGTLMSVVPVYGGTRYKGDLELRRKVMEMPWASNQGVVEAIPPRYTEFIGEQLMALASPSPR